MAPTQAAPSTSRQTDARSVRPVEPSVHSTGGTSALGVRSARRSRSAGTLPAFSTGPPSASSARMPRSDSAAVLNQRMEPSSPRRRCRWDGVQERLGQRFLERDLLVEQRVLDRGRDVLGERGEVLEIAVAERAAGGAVADEEPAQQAPAGEERHEHLGADGVERAAEQEPLLAAGESRGRRARGLGVQFQQRTSGSPAGYWRAAFPRGSCVPRAAGRRRCGPGEEADAGDRGVVGDPVDDVLQQRLDVADVAQRGGEVVEREGHGHAAGRARGSAVRGRARGRTRRAGCGSPARGPRGRSRGP